MADKTVTATRGVPVATVATAGTIAVNVVDVVFDEASDSATVLSLLERAKVAVIDYYSDKSS